MYLAITDGSSTVVLSGNQTIRGCTYAPRSPGGSSETAALGLEPGPVAESIDLVLEGTEAAIISQTQAIERLLWAAQRRQETQTGARVRLEYERVSGGQRYRSEVLAGRLVWPTAAGRRRLGDSTNTVSVTVALERRWFWEGDLVQLLLTSNVTTTAATEAIVRSQDDISGQVNWVQVAGAQLEGVIPAPVRVSFRNVESGNVIWGGLIMANMLHVGNTFDTFLRAGEAANSTGNWAADTETRLYRFVLPLGIQEGAGGRLMRVWAFFNSLTSGTRLRAKLSLYTGVVPIYAGELWRKGDSGAVDLGAMPIPPGRGIKSSNLNLEIWGLNKGGGSVGLDFVYIVPSDRGVYRWVQMIGTEVDANGKIVDDGIEGELYQEDGADPTLRTPSLRPYGTPLLLWPGATQRIRFMAPLRTGWTANLTAGVSMWYRPRRLTL